MSPLFSPLSYHFLFYFIYLFFLSLSYIMTFLLIATNMYQKKGTYMIAKVLYYATHTLYSCILTRSTTTTKLLQSYVYFLFVGHIGKVAWIHDKRWVSHMASSVLAYSGSTGLLVSTASYMFVVVTISVP